MRVNGRASIAKLKQSMLWFRKETFKNKILLAQVLISTLGLKYARKADGAPIIDLLANRY